MIITTDHIKAICPNGDPRITAALPNALNHWLPIYGMTDRHVVTMFLGQAAEETDGFKTLKEYASGAAYEGRADLGNTQPGDGVRFAGKGIFMQTGRANYTAEGKELGLDLVNHPELLLVVDNAVQAACAYWRDHHLTPLAMSDDIVAVTRKINGGENGLASRETYWHRAQNVITENLDVPAGVANVGALPQAAPPKQIPPVAPSVPPATPKPSVTLSKPPSISSRLAAFLTRRPVAPQGLIGDTQMAVLSTSNLNVGSVSVLWSSLVTILPIVLKEGSTVGYIAAGALGVAALVQTFLPTGAAAIENAVIDGVAIGDVVLPQMKPTLDKVAQGVKDFEAQNAGQAPSA